MTEFASKAWRVDVQPLDGVSHVTIERDGEHHELGSLRELIAYLERVAEAEDRPIRGLR